MCLVPNVQLMVDMHCAPVFVVVTGLDTFDSPLKRVTLTRPVLRQYDRVAAWAIGKQAIY